MKPLPALFTHVYKDKSDKRSFQHHLMDAFCRHNHNDLIKIQSLSLLARVNTSTAEMVRSLDRIIIINNDSH